MSRNVNIQQLKPLTELKTYELVFVSRSALIFKNSKRVNHVQMYLNLAEFFSLKKTNEFCIPLEKISDNLDHFYIELDHVENFSLTDDIMGENILGPYLLKSGEKEYELNLIYEESKHLAYA